ncbi:MAG: diacylglycerol kinase family protein [Oscillospiraceae bacterium]|jgi:diacylglycerol kinase
MKCFVYAFRGIIYTIRTERNMRIHLCVAFYVILAGIVTGIRAAEWAAVLICIALVLSAECLNTAVETACNAIHPGNSHKVARVKDIAAGSVLICAAFSAVVGGVIFFRAEKLARTARFAAQHPLAAAAIVLTLPVWIYFIFFSRKLKNERNRYK